jgi:DNA modification methylase
VTPYYSDDLVTIYHGDCREWMPSADVLVTDPPYGIGEQQAMVGRNGSSRLWGKGEAWDAEPADLSHLPDVPSIVWGGNYFGLPPSRGWLIWDKAQSFSGADAELAWTNLDMPVRVFRMSRVAAYNGLIDGPKSHPTQKPVELMRWCIEFAPPGTVLDPFMGSGTTLVAAKSLGRRAIGIEIEERYCEIAANRCRQEVLGLVAA